jgi:hypothetical protein
MNSRVGSEIQVRSFNQSIKSSLCNSTVGYTYINTYTYLINYGYSCDQGTATDTGYDDGLHYSVKTSKRIYQFCINVINNAV